MNTPPDWTLLQSREIRHTLREVFRGPESLLIKRFSWSGSRHDRREPWIREHLALQQLDGLGFPTSRGFSRVQDGDRTVVTLTRHFIEGEVLDRVGEEDLPGIVDGLVVTHRRHVVSCDPSLENFIRSSEGTIRLLDFGRARIFSGASLMFHFYLGKELARFHRTALLGDAKRWAQFQPLYFEALAPGAAAERIIRLGIRFWMKRWRKRGFPRPPAGA